jgi:glycosyltransferase involved in cell wall biosynthesis
VSFPHDVTVVMPHIPVRPHSLARAVSSAANQTHRARDLVVATDLDREGSAPTRNRALLRATTTWVAFLDDDDVWLPNHLATLLRHAEETGADVTYAGCTVIGRDGRDIPRREEWGRFGLPFDADLLRRKAYMPVTCLARTELAQKALFGPPAGVDTPYDDWGFYLRMLDLGAAFSHIPEITWIWYHHGLNTSGQPNRW